MGSKGPIAADSGGAAGELPAGGEGRRLNLSSDLLLLLGVASATLLVHLFTGRRFGFHRDELATLDDARHLAWGFVAYPPLTPFFGRLSLVLFGTSLTGFRFFAAVAQAAAVVLTGLMARELGGGRKAQSAAALAAVPFCLAGGALMQYVSFDYLFWVLTAYFVVKLQKTGEPRWWLGIGGAMGLGMLTKYTMGFFALGIALATLFTPARRYLKNRWLWYGAALLLLIFLPNLLWQVQNQFISLEFLKQIHLRDVRIGRTRNFLPGQLGLTLLATPLWLAGLFYCLFAQAARRFRMLAWMYLVPLGLFVAAKGRSYYLAPAYPMLYAAGSVWGERLLGRFGRWQARSVGLLVAAALLTDIGLAAGLFLPVGEINSRWWEVANKVQGDFREELGWQELAQTVGEIRDSLPEKERARLGVLAGNYGEAGAIALYGDRFSLPRPISGINSFWAHGYGDPPPETLIVIGLSRRFLDENFASCRLAGHTGNRYGVKNEETVDHPDLYVCRELRTPWPVFWERFRYFG